MSPRDSSVERATLRRIWREVLTLERFKDESGERFGACSRCGWFTVAFWMRFIAYPSAVQEKLNVLASGPAPQGQQTWQVWSSCHPRALAECGPIVHEMTALLEKIAAPIGGFDRIADGVGEGLLYDVVRVGGRLGGPISKRAAKAMDRSITFFHCLR